MDVVLVFLTHFSPVLHFYTSWKRQRFSDVFRGIEMKHWAKMGWSWLFSGICSQNIWSVSNLFRNALISEIIHWDIWCGFNCNHVDKNMFKFNNKDSSKTSKDVVVMSSLLTLNVYLSKAQMTAFFTFFEVCKPAWKYAKLFFTVTAKNARGNKMRVIHSVGDHSFISLQKIFQKTNISYPLIRTRTCAYQGVRDVSFSENFANVINEGSLGRLWTLKPVLFLGSWCRIETCLRTIHQWCNRLVYISIVKSAG